MVWRHTRNYILLANLVKLQDYEWKQKYLPYLESNGFFFVLCDNSVIVLDWKVLNGVLRFFVLFYIPIVHFL